MLEKPVLLDHSRSHLVTVQLRSIILKRKNNNRYFGFDGRSCSRI